MKLTIAENLREFRKIQGNTQEELSGYLGISVQAVSKWERGEGCPDITLLPLIAAYYEKTVDELLGCDAIKRNRKTEEFEKEYRERCKEGRMEEAILVMRNALKIFPYNLSFLLNLAESLLFVQKSAYLDECIDSCLKILDKSTDDEQRYSALKTIVCAYGRKKETAKAKEYARKLPGVDCTQNMVLLDALEGEERVRQAQQNIITFVNFIDNSVMWMLNSGEYTSEEKIFAYETVDKLYKLFLYDGNYGMEHIALFMLWMCIAKEYAKCGEKEKTIKALKTACKHAREADCLKSAGYTSLFADRGSYSGDNIISKTPEGSFADEMTAEMQKELFDFIRETAEFQEMMKAKSGVALPGKGEGIRI